MEHNIIHFIDTVRTMRNAQKQYFINAATARKTKAPADWAASANALKHSKELEHQVDAMVDHLTTKQQSPAELT